MRGGGSAIWDRVFTAGGQGSFQRALNRKAVYMIGAVFKHLSVGGWVLLRSDGGRDTRCERGASWWRKEGKGS